MSANPDQAFRAIYKMWYEIFGAKGMFRQEPITAQEWFDLSSRLRTLVAMNLRALELKENNDERASAST